MHGLERPCTFGRPFDANHANSAADAYGIYQLIDDINVNGKTFSKASDNGNGNNTPAGPDATTDPSLLPLISDALFPNE